MSPTSRSVLSAIVALAIGGLSSAPAPRVDVLTIAQAPAGEVAQGIPVKEREAPPDDPAVDQAGADADARLPAVDQPADVADPFDVVQPDDE